MVQLGRQEQGDVQLSLPSILTCLMFLVTFINYQMIFCRTVFYGQFQCSGPGADHGGRVAWSRELTQQEAKPFISIDFIDGHEWLKHK